MPHLQVCQLGHPNPNPNPNPNPKQACYIYKCVNSVIFVKDKINSIALDGCKKCQVVFADVISGVELVDCDATRTLTLTLTPTLTLTLTLTPTLT